MIPKRVVKEIPILYKPNMTVITNKEKVTYYARVSTENEEQEDSFERQRDHFSSKIRANPDWEYVEGYADWGVTGTRADSRKEFMRMIEDCRAGKINRILVKSISRFGRNTVDTLKYIRELRELGISVFFETQNIDTMSAKGDMMLIVLSAIAEEESRTMSTNIKWAFQKRFKDGQVIINYRFTLGYTKVDDEYVIVESEAEIVRRIFREYLGGKSTRQLATELNNENIRTKRGNRWNAQGISNILTNERYTGNAVLGKTFKPDVLSKCRIKNEGQAPSYYVENSHPAIVSQEMFDMVQMEMARRKDMRSSTDTGRGRYSSKYALSGLLVCGRCGGKLRRFGRESANGYVPLWICITHQKQSQDCALKPIKETDVLAAYRRAVQKLIGDYAETIEIVRESLESLKETSQSTELNAIQDELAATQQRILDLFKQKREGLINDYEYEREYAKLSEKVLKLSEQEKTAKEQDVGKQMSVQRIEQAIQLLGSDEVDCTEPSIMRIVLDCIKVINSDALEFQFKCGVSITEKL